MPDNAMQLSSYQQDISITSACVIAFGARSLHLYGPTSSACGTLYHHCCGHWPLVATITTGQYCPWARAPGLHI